MGDNLAKVLVKIELFLTFGFLIVVIGILGYCLWKKNHPQRPENLEKPMSSFTKLEDSS